MRRKHYHTYLHMPTRPTCKVVKREGERGARIDPKGCKVRTTNPCLTRSPRRSCSAWACRLSASSVGASGYAWAADVHLICAVIQRCTNKWRYINVIPCPTVEFPRHAMQPARRAPAERSRSQPPPRATERWTVFNGWSHPLHLELTGSFENSVGDEVV